MSDVPTTKYVAICNNSKFDGHYVVTFDMPTMFTEKCKPTWYFMNVVDHIACVEAIYPASIFDASDKNHWHAEASAEHISYAKMLILGLE